MLLICGVPCELAIHACTASNDAKTSTVTCAHALLLSSSVYTVRQVAGIPCLSHNHEFRVVLGRVEMALAH